MSSSPPLGQFLELALRTPSGRHTVPSVQPSFSLPRVPQPKAPRASAHAPQPQRGPAAPNYPTSAGQWLQSPGRQEKGCWRSFCVGVIKLKSGPESGHPEILHSKCPPAPCLRESATENVPGPPSATSGEWGGQMVSQVAPAEAAECHSSHWENGADQLAVVQEGLRGLLGQCSAPARSGLQHCSVWALEGHGGPLPMSGWDAGGGKSPRVTR